MTAIDIFNCPIINKVKLVEQCRTSFNTLYYKNLRNLPFDNTDNYQIEKQFETIKLLSKRIDLRSLKYILPYIKLQRVCREANVGYVRMWRHLKANKELTTKDAEAMGTIFKKYFGE